MKWIGQHIYDQISRFRDDVYLEDISTGVIVSGAHLGLDSNNKIVKAVDSANLTGHVTSLGNVTTLAATQPAIESIGTDGDSLSILGDTLIMQNTTTNKPEIQLINFVDDTTGPRFSLTNKRKSSGLTPTGIQPGEDSDTLGTIIFQGYDSQPLTQDYAAIIASIHEAASDEESGKLALRVANHDGGLGSGLVMSGGLRDDEVNVTIGLGANSVVTVPGNLVVSGSTVIKVLPSDFMANEDGGANKSILYDDSGVLGVRTSSDNAELYAFVEIPFGKTATSVIVHGNDTGNVVEVFEAAIDASGLTDRTPGGGCVVGTACNMTDVEASDKNYLAIRITTTTAASDIVYGAAVTVINTNDL